MTNSYLFQKRKKQQFTKKDKSSIGSIDKRIEKLCKRINIKKEYYTTSSCSGRICLVKEPLKKKKGLIIKSWHEKINLKDLNKELKKIKEKEIIILKQEPCLVCVACNNLDCASNLLELAREKAGWKQSGIMTMKKRIILELRSSENLSVPVMSEGKIVVDKEYLKLIVNESNKRLVRTWEKLERLESLI